MVPKDSADDVEVGGNLVGVRLDERYEVLGVLGRGGMGTAYRARDTRMERDVVVKVPHAVFLAEEGFRERFAKEVRSLTVLEHPAIVKVLDAGSVRGVPYAVMQYLAGKSLRERVAAAGGRHTPSEVAAWLPVAAEALDYVHSQGVVHRDVKPANILFDRAGKLHLGDFGIAKALSSADSGLTATGMTPGSPDYMAPEQVTGGTLTQAVDQYALASVVYEALSGGPPFPAQTPLAVLVRKQTEAAPDLASRAPNLPAAAAAVVMRGLERDPSRRHASCGELARAFLDALRPKAEPTRSAAPRARPTVGTADKGEAPRPARRRWVPALGVLAVAGLALAGWALFGRGPDGGPGGGGPEEAVDRVAPVVELTSPATTRSIVDAPEVRIAGRARDENLARVLVDGGAAEVAADGSFAVTIRLAEGVESVVVVQAVDRAGNRSPDTRVHLRYVRPAEPGAADLAAAGDAGRSGAWDDVREHLAKAKAAGATDASVPAWITEGLARWDAPAELLVDEPVEGASVPRGSRVPVRGRLRSARPSDEVFVDGVPATVERASGGEPTFHASVRPLDLGAVTIQIRVVDRRNERARVDRSVVVVDPASLALERAVAAAARGDWATATTELETARERGLPSGEAVPPELEEGVRVHSGKIEITLAAPADGESVEGLLIPVRGTVKGLSDSVTLWVGDEKVSVVEGRFSTTGALERFGTTEIAVEARWKDEVLARATRRVVATVPPPSPGPWQYHVSLAVDRARERGHDLMILFTSPAT